MVNWAFLLLVMGGLRYCFASHPHILVQIIDQQSVILN
jgi:hypothetical protein